MKHPKWSKIALDAYKQVGEEMRTLGFRPLRSLPDPDCQTELTFWVGPFGKDAQLRTIITQSWIDTGDTCFYGAIELSDIQRTKEQAEEVA
jgi:hypothetical protein